jgi:hypothetical protein
VISNVKKAYSENKKIIPSFNKVYFGDLSNGTKVFLKSNQRAKLKADHEIEFYQKVSNNTKNSDYPEYLPKYLGVVNEDQLRPSVLLAFISRCVPCCTRSSDKEALALELLDPTKYTNMVDIHLGNSRRLTSINDETINYLAKSLQDLHKNHSLEIGGDLWPRNILIHNEESSGKFIDFEESTTSKGSPMTDSDLMTFVTKLSTINNQDMALEHLEELYKKKDLCDDYRRLARLIYITNKVIVNPEPSDHLDK